ncbi:hypothetical protein [Georgenia subflava]|uniref:Uncharacterized protein n=1 Tax=Georgenia subflava TaxID=1622177 RepID=A0A6N7EGK2_9MICO|nr:hypothetical protein [Georgenia subflava]MPV36098.1 hypothetical protein [Georgenia subflava]
MTAFESPRARRERERAARHRAFDELAQLVSEGVVPHDVAVAMFRELAPRSVQDTLPFDDPDLRRHEHQYDPVVGQEWCLQCNSTAESCRAGGL